VESGEEAMNLSYRRNSATPLNETIGRRFMKAVSLQTTLQLTFLAIVLSAMGRADAKDTAAVSKQEVQAKIRYCQDCHGLSGQGFRGFFPIPRLAGQQPEYLKNQLQAFVERRRTNNIMFNVAHVLKPAMIEAIATSFKSLNPKPLGGAPKKLVAAGKNIFENGIPDANVAACAACHGPEATGHGEIPRLAGQLDSYVVMELTTWTHERGQSPANPDTSAIMKPVAHSLTKPQIEAVAAYVSSLK
jgi:cytochrome c553